MNFVCLPEDCGDHTSWNVVLYCLVLIFIFTHFTLSDELEKRLSVHMNLWGILITVCLKVLVLFKFSSHLGKLRTEFTSPMAKSTSPGLLDITSLCTAEMQRRRKIKRCETAHQTSLKNYLKTLITLSSVTVAQWDKGQSAER